MSHTTLELKQRSVDRALELFKAVDLEQGGIRKRAIARAPGNLTHHLARTTNARIETHSVKLPICCTTIGRTAVASHG